MAEATPLSPEPQPDSPNSSRELARQLVECARERQAEDIQILDISELSSFADFFLILSGLNERHVEALVNGMSRSMRDHGRKPHHIEGETENRWVLLDYGDVVVHVFLQELRKFYQIEKLWADAPEVQL